MTQTSLDFDYPWWLESGHLVLFAAGALLILVGWRLKWSRMSIGLVAVVTIWAGLAAAAIAAVGINRVPPLPTERFLEKGAGRVLDMGAGTGRSTLMVLAARPSATVVALDLFGESFDMHFGREGRPEDRLLANLRRAGVESRARVVAGDMREMPFQAGEFDAIVSAYAIDHLGREGAARALGEAARVLAPGGDFLLILVHDDAWTRFTFGPMLAHGGLPAADWWRSRAAEAGFDLREEGRRPATEFFLLRRRG